ncbi:MAG: thioredoxin [Clostridiales bacterium]|nr:thioredoxin [Clostridiales bacterium]
MEIILTKENFENEVYKSQTPVLVDFWATWCGPCMMLMPTVEKIAREYDGKVKVGKVNVDEQMELAVKFGIEVIPTLLYFVDGKPVKKSVGAVSKEEIEKMFI